MYANTNTCFPFVLNTPLFAFVLFEQDDQDLGCRLEQRGSNRTCNVVRTCNSPNLPKHCA